MRTLGSILKAIGGFSLVMTGLRLWQVGFPRLEGPEGETWANVFRILAPYAIMGLISFGIIGLGGYLANRPLSKEEEMERDERVVSFYQTTLSAWANGKLADLHESFKKSADRMRLADLMDKYQPYNEIAIRTLFENFCPVPSEFLVGIGHNWFVLTNIRLIQKDGKTNEFKEVTLADIDLYEIRQDNKITLIFKMKSGNEILFENVQGYPRPDFMSKLIPQTIVA